LTTSTVHRSTLDPVDESRAYARLAVQVVTFAVHDLTLRVGLTRGATPLSVGEQTLPRAFVGPTETLQEAATRVLHDVIGRDQTAHLDAEQVVTWSAPIGEHQTRTATTVFIAVASKGFTVSGPAWVTIQHAAESLLIAEDAAVLTAAASRVDDLLGRTTIATLFLGEHFTIRELQRVYEAVRGTRLDPETFTARSACAAVSSPIPVWCVEGTEAPVCMPEATPTDYGRQWTGTNGHDRPDVDATVRVWASESCPSDRWPSPPDPRHTGETHGLGPGPPGPGSGRARKPQ
jgi:8-oxo-dGTP diphosphatase